MNRIKFSGIVAVLLLLAGCAVPVGYPGYYGGYGGYEAYGGAYTNPYSQVPVTPYGYSGVSPYYGYGYESGSSVIVNNPVPVPVYPSRPYVNDPYCSSGNQYSRPFNHRHHRPYNGNNQTTNPADQGTGSPGDSATDQLVGPAGTTAAGQGGRIGSETGQAAAGQNGGSQVRSNWNPTRPGAQMSALRPQSGSGGPGLINPGSSGGSVSPLPGQTRLNGQPRIGAPSYQKAPLGAPNMSGPVMRAPSFGGLAGTRSPGATAMRPSSRTSQGQPSGNSQKKAFHGMP